MNLQEAILYVHGKGGNALEAEHLKPICENYDVFAIDLNDFTPWGTKNQIQSIFETLQKTYFNVSVIANSIGAYFSMFALQGYNIKKAFFISPILDMEKLIFDMMKLANITKEELREKKEIVTYFGEKLSWEYLLFVQNNTIKWNIPTEILYAENDNMTSYETVKKFVKSHNAVITVMKNGEHWFHTSEQIEFLDKWLSAVI